MEDEAMIFAPAAGARVAGHLEIATIVVTHHSVFRRIE